MSNKLELTWYGKDKRIEIEPRILIENPNLSYERTSESLFDDDCTYDNMLIHGDNLLALKALEQQYTNKIKCVYIDPPYNTGSAFEHYDDNLEHSIWLGLMKERLEILRNLLCDEGSIFIQIDDEEQAYLKVLCDEIFGRSNFINMISINLKNVAGASGGGEDKRLKKNCEFILIYAKDYLKLKPFKPIYSYKPIAKLVEDYKAENKSWKYTSVLVDPGEKEYITSTEDGDGNEIKIYKRNNLKTMSVRQFAQQNNISENDVYNYHFNKIFRTEMPQSSIRPRVMDKMNELGLYYKNISIEYVPKTGQNKGLLYEQFYTGEKYNLFAWLSDTVEVINNVAMKKDLQGTYWDFVGETKNLTKEGNVQFPNGKKSEREIKRILDMATDQGDIVLDSFLGSGTTAAVSHKMKRKYIGIEMGEHAYSHCKVRLDNIIDGNDRSGISDDVDWENGGGYRFYELAPTLITKDCFDEEIINKEYNAEMLASAVALHEGFIYKPNENIFWKQSFANENSYLFVTTKHVTKNLVDAIKQSMNNDEFLIIACKSYDSSIIFSQNITIKKIPQMLLNRCEFGVDNYNLNIISPPKYEDMEEDDYE